LLSVHVLLMWVLREGDSSNGLKESSVTQLRNNLAESLSRAELALLDDEVVCLSNHLIRVDQILTVRRSKMADWRAQIERVRLNDPTLTELE
jgi:hypothetical protein